MVSISKYQVPDIAPWTLKTAEIRFDLAARKKSETDRHAFQTKFHEIKYFYFAFKPIYTNGSKCDDSVASAAVCGQNHSEISPS